MDKNLIREMAAELGVSPATLNPLRGIPFPKAVEGLRALQEAAKKNFGRLAVKYHPDHNTGREEWAARMFNALMVAKEAIESLRVSPGRPARPMPVPINPVWQAASTTTTWGPTGNTTRTTYFPVGFGNMHATATGSGIGYDARRVVFVRFR